MFSGQFVFIQYEILLVVGFTMSEVPRLIDSEFPLKISSNKRRKNLFLDAIRKLSGRKTLKEENEAWELKSNQKKNK